MTGKKISHYEVLEKLGAGGMGVVYKARDLKLDRLVALKFLPPHLSADEEQKSRFIHEARAASVMDHPNVGAVYEIDETPDGRLFIAMAYYEGESLKKKTGEGPLGIDAAVDYALQIARGLSEAHRHGIVHRDLKPQNILIGRNNTAKIIDFGLAKFSAAQTQLTKAGTTLGTIAYMSPEQARGDEITPKTDIWSLGVILYEMLTGRLPFRGEYETAIVYCILNEPHPPVRGIRPDVPEALEAVVDAALAKDAAKRTASAEEIIAELGSPGAPSAGGTAARMRAAEAAAGASATGTTVTIDVRRTARRGGLAAAIILAAAAGWWLLRPLLTGPSVPDSEKTVAVVPVGIPGDAESE